MITIGSGANNIQLYSKELQSFQKDCLLFEQDNHLFKISYIPEDNGIKTYHSIQNYTEAIEIFWKILTRNFAAIHCQTEKKIVFLIEDDLLKIVNFVNCSCDLKTIFGGNPLGCRFDELLKEEKDSSHLWAFNSLDGQPTQERFWLKRKEILAEFKNHSFWAYRFSRSKRIYRTTEMTQHQPPISSVG